MTKQEAIALFVRKNSTSPIGDLAREVRVSSSAISQWNDNELTYHNIDKIFWAAKRKKLSQKVIDRLEKLLKTMRG